MEIIPAIDLINGECVRLIQGDYSRKTVYDKDPVKIAQKWKEQGAKRIHVVDLDGAKAGHPVNTEVLKSITDATGLPIETGGGIRTLQDIQTVLDAGAQWAILGTSAIKDPEFTQKALERFGEQIIIGIDARDGKVAISGWEETTQTDAFEFARKVQDMGAKSIIYTDIATDGMMKGPNLEALRALSEKVSISVIASGGISSIENVKALKQLNKQNIAGCIIGKALYINTIDLPEAIREANNN